MIYFTSDTHFGHEWILQHRMFNNVKDMDAHIVNEWNNTVQHTDIVFHLGDVFFNNKSLDAVEALHGKKFLIPGNHDHSSRKKMLPFFTICDRIHYLKGREINTILDIDNAVRICMCHFPLIDWATPIWHLHGHFHGDSLPWKPSGAIMDVSWDVKGGLFSWTDIMTSIPQIEESKRHE